ncbi:uncharacterized protein Z518_08010 [Rhinocladiella mackenziei CBS 650.93]|uniref:Indoleamine 2,3-dioxygenase n=1 Tax=Rhinocladiella mackenziei CBS 650.93 TaxID=1442369 RepID=A0A0D2IFN8_9EURO|nr:uncharacterized protein Z518_08010 [Rhinocladiella mackenziei CBS 650.93]KIX02071.1 hypothetical protein Z518_08010 [Rhinocladiella mackenziei CBS 650.93]
MLSRPLIPDPGEYDIDPDIGFVTPTPAELPEYYAPWHQLCSALPQLLKSKNLRIKIESLDILTTDHLTSLSHWQRAYVILGFLTQAYVWQDKTSPSAAVPASLGDPFIKVCEYLGMKPVLSYAGLCLWNWLPTRENNIWSPSETLSGFDNIKSTALFTGTRDEDAFYLVPVMVEAQGGKLVQLFLDAVTADQKGNGGDLLSTLQTCAARLKTMGETMSVLHQNCDPGFFYHRIRPMIAGSAGAEEKGLPNGVTLQCSNGSEVVVKCVGGSAGQSSLFQFLDHMFGVEHESKLLYEMRPYMPKNHREFLETVELLPSLRHIMERHPEDGRLRKAFQLVIENFKQWRTRHVVVVSRYIVQPAAAEAKREEVNGQPNAEPKGTGGSLPIPFLKQYRDETVFSSEN